MCRILTPSCPPLLHSCGQLEEAQQEAEVARGQSQKLQAQVEELREKMSPPGPTETSLLSELETSIVPKAWALDKEQVGLSDAAAGGHWAEPQDPKPQRCSSQDRAPCYYCADSSAAIKEPEGAHIKLTPTQLGLNFDKSWGKSGSRVEGWEFAETRAATSSAKESRECGIEPGGVRAAGELHPCLASRFPALCHAALILVPSAVFFPREISYLQLSLPPPPGNPR